MGATREEHFEVAIIGGGIIGLCLGAGLLSRDIPCKIYEQAPQFREVGAGIAFTNCAVQCMKLLDPEVESALRSAGAVPLSAGDTQDNNDYLRWIDGYNSHPGQDPHWQKFLYKVNAGFEGFMGVRRDQFADHLAKLIPPDRVEMGKRLESIAQDGDKILLIFSDGTTDVTDAVIGCDGVRSKVRQIMHGKDNPCSYPHYAHVVSYRTVIPMEAALPVLGEKLAFVEHNHVGPSACILHYAVAGQTALNVTAFVWDNAEWPANAKTATTGTRAELQRAFHGWNPTVTKLINILPETMGKWAVWDTWDYHVPFYNQGQVCLAGDAAHASSPHHGAGAGMGIEDAICLATLLEQVTFSVQDNPSIKKHALSTAFAVYDNIRRTRCQWFVNSSRRMCDLQMQAEWADPAKLYKAQTCFEEIQDRSRKIWDFDYNSMLMDSLLQYREQLALGMKSGNGIAQLGSRNGARPLTNGYGYH